MDRLLRRRLVQIARDRRSGAAEIASHAVASLQTWLRRHTNPSESELLEIARALLRAQPSMAPLLRLANEVALAAGTSSRASALQQVLRTYEIIRRSSQARMARFFRNALRRRSKWRLATYSYSSTVVNALLGVRSRISEVICPESRPGLEGRVTAARLADRGISAWVLTDMAALNLIPTADAFVCGADSILHELFINKIGTHEILRSLEEAGKSVWVLADTTKFLPEGLEPFHAPRMGPRGGIWKRAPANVITANPYFGAAPLGRHVRVLTEKGWMTPARVRRELRKIRISPQLKSLVD